MIYLLDISSLFDWRYLLVLLTGTIFGFFFMLLLYLYSVVRSLNKKKGKQKGSLDLDELEISLLVKDAEEQFKDKEKRKEVGVFPHFKEVNIDLISDIAKKYYPTSKYPLLELSIEESLELSKYITLRVDEFLSARILAPFKRKTLAQIKGIYDVKIRVEEMKVVKASKKVGINKISKTVLGVMNLINPAYWIKRITVDKLYDIIIVKICLASIGIIGEESYKIYSKSVFKEEDKDVNVDQLYEDFIVDELGEE